MKDDLCFFIFPLLVAIPFVFVPIALYFFIWVIRIGTSQALPYVIISMSFLLISSLCVYFACRIYVYKFRKKEIKGILDINFFKSKAREDIFPDGFLESYKKKVDEKMIKYLDKEGLR